MRRLARELKSRCQITTLKYDPTSVLNNNTYSPKTKHITLRFFYLKGLVASNNIVTDLVGTDNMLEDICTT